MGFLEQRKLTVAFIVFGDLDERSGGFLYDRKLAQALEAAGDSVRVVSQRDGGILRRLAGNGRRLLTELERLEVDLVLIDELNHAATFLLLPLLRRRLAVPVVALVHHLRCEEKLGPFERAAERAMEKRFLAGVDAFIFNSEATAAAVRTLAETGDKPHLVAYPGKDRYAAFVAPTTRPRPSALHILFVGNLIPRKNLDVLIRAVQAASREGSRTGAPRLRLDVCGDDRVDPAYTARVAALAQSRGCGEAIHFHGRVDDARLGALLAQADVLAVPSDLEGFGIVYLEAMSAGVVPIASSRGGAAELVREGVDGFLVPPRDEATLTRRLAELMDDPDRLAAMREAGLRRAASFPTWEESMASIRDFLHEVAGEAKR